MNLLKDYLLFIGMGLYLLSGVLFLLLFLRTLRTKDGIGLFFLKILTCSLAIGSLTVFVVRFLGLYAGLDEDLARIIATVNPITLLGVGLYLNYLFHHPEKPLTSADSKNISEIKKDVKLVKQDMKNISEVKEDVKVVKQDIKEVKKVLK